MDSIHDLGGMHGFGPIRREPDEPVFHAAWEGRMFAMDAAVSAAVDFGGDQFRPRIEAMDPAHYLRSSYYEKWYVATVTRLLARGVVSAVELAGQSAAAPLKDPANPLRPADVATEIFTGYPQNRPDHTTSRRFTVGDRVITRSHMPAHHNRLPRYARGRPGTIESVHGPFRVADPSNGGQPDVETLYTVVFAARDLWGPEAAPGDRLSLDCWDRYLVPAS